MRKKICVITGSRAEFGILSRLMRLIEVDSELSLQIIVTGMHLSPEFGLTYKQIENTGFNIDKKVEMLLSSDTANAISKSIGLGIIGFADAYDDLKPDLILVLGDRFEILAAVSAALFFRIPVAHLHGGEITEGAVDNSIRHAITKMSHIHFTSAEIYRKRVIQMGENPEFVFNVGALGLDNIRYLKLLSKSELEDFLNFSLNDCIMVTFHPVTLEDSTAEEQMGTLLKALHSMSNLRILFTYPNSDTNGRIIIQMINRFVEENKSKSVAFKNLGQLKYLSSLQYVRAVVGNSSSGIIEAPYFNIPSLNIGDRQKGRLKAKTVIDCKNDIHDIIEKLSYVLSIDKSQLIKEQLSLNPYSRENTADQIISVIKSTPLDKLVVKGFHNF